MQMILKYHEILIGFQSILLQVWDHVSGKLKKDLQYQAEVSYYLVNLFTIRFLCRIIELSPCSSAYWICISLIIEHVITICTISLFKAVVEVLLYVGKYSNYV